ncbi:MAG: HvfC family RiPP maturation protein [Gammaproteobacteria bacterium]
MAEAAPFIAQQYAFAAHLRDPAHNPAPAGIEDRRLKIYRELFFNNVSGLLAGTFPVIRKILGDEAWRKLMRDYFSRHESHTPLFLEMPQEFLRFLEEERGEHPEDPPFLKELAHYEWVELALSIEETEPELSGIDRAGDLLEGRPVKSPLAWSLAYAWPVHRLSPDFRPDAPGETPTFLVVYRTLADKVGFIEINAVTARLLELVEADERLTGREMLARIATELAHPNPDAVLRGGAEILENLHRHEVILGIEKN